MNFRDLIATLSAALPKSLADAKALIAQSASALTAAVAELDTKIAALATAEQATATANAALATAQASLATVTTDLQAAIERANTAETGVLSVLKSAGLTVEKLDPAAIKAAVSTRAETIGHELLAARGMKPLPEAIKSSEVEAKLQTDDEIAAAYLEMKPGSPESIAFLEKHQAAIWRAHTTRK